ncbi:MAG TPA: hypothetical protein VKI44_00870 [Acetobacteraceae bacterium]|nr:hypothetical protein [Acetobacteraceae bacterium]
MARSPETTDANNVAALFDEPVAEEVEVGRDLAPAQPEPSPAGGASIDLTDKPKVLMAIGAGGTGKTMLLRYFTDELLARDSDARLAAIDPEKRELKSYFQGVLEPPGYDPDTVLTWLRGFLSFLTDHRGSALVDIGGGDTALPRLVGELPTLAADMEAAGVHPVAIYPMTPRVSDLSPLATLERAGFQPKATAIVLNEGRMPTADRDAWFGQHRHHSVYRAAMSRGAVELWMPRLSEWKKVEDRQFRFTHARDGIVSEGRKAVPLGLLDRAGVRTWMGRMQTAFAPISSWIP